MGEIFTKIFFFIVLLPYILARQGWKMCKEYMNKKEGRWEMFPYIILAILVFILLVAFAAGYRY